VLGINVVTPTPPVGVVYHNKVLPAVAVAVRATAVAPWQYIGDAPTIGAAGVGVIVVVNNTLGLLSQPFNICVT
jgi:hypothetical protein